MVVKEKTWSSSSKCENGYQLSEDLTNKSGPCIVKNCVLKRWRPLQTILSFIYLQKTWCHWASNTMAYWFTHLDAFEAKCIISSSHQQSIFYFCLVFFIFHIFISYLMSSCYTLHLKQVFSCFYKHIIWILKIVQNWLIKQKRGI